MLSIYNVQCSMFSEELSRCLIVKELFNKSKYGLITNCKSMCVQYDHKRVSMLANRLIQKIMSEIPDVIMNGDPEQRYPGEWASGQTPVKEALCWFMCYTQSSYIIFYYSGLVISVKNCASKVQYDKLMYT